MSFPAGTAGGAGCPRLVQACRRRSLWRALRDDPPPSRSYLIGKLMRQAKPDDALQFVSPQEMADLWPSIERYLGKTRPFWTWLLEQWERRGFIKR